MVYVNGGIATSSFNMMCLRIEVPAMAGRRTGTRAEGSPRRSTHNSVNRLNGLSTTMKVVKLRETRTETSRMPCTGSSETESCSLMRRDGCEGRSDYADLLHQWQVRQQSSRLLMALRKKQNCLRSAEVIRSPLRFNCSCSKHGCTAIRLMSSPTGLCWGSTWHFSWQCHARRSQTVHHINTASG